MILDAIAPGTILHGWLFAARDLCDQGALSARLELADGVMVLYRPGKGWNITGPDGSAQIPEDYLDGPVGYVPVDEPGLETS